MLPWKPVITLFAGGHVPACQDAGSQWLAGLYLGDTGVPHSPADLPETTEWPARMLPPSLACFRFHTLSHRGFL